MYQIERFKQYKESMIDFEFKWDCIGQKDKNKWQNFFSVVIMLTSLIIYLKGVYWN